MDKLQEKIYLYQILKSQEENFLKQIALLEEEKRELKNEEKVLQELENKRGQEFFASLGENCFVKAEIRDDRVLVNVGAGILVRKKISDAVEVLKKRIEEIESAKKEAEERLKKIEEQIERIEPEIEKLVSKSK